MHFYFYIKILIFTMQLTKCRLEWIYTSKYHAISISSAGSSHVIFMKLFQPMQNPPQEVDCSLSFIICSPIHYSVELIFLAVWILKELCHENIKSLRTVPLLLILPNNIFNNIFWVSPAYSFKLNSQPRVSKVLISDLPHA